MGWNSSDSRDGSARLENEDGVLGASLLLTAALDATAVAEVLSWSPVCMSVLLVQSGDVCAVLTIEWLASSDSASLLECNVGRRRWVGERTAGCTLVGRSSECGVGEDTGDGGESSERDLNHDYRLLSE